MGDVGSFREENMEDDSSELSDLESVTEKEVEVEKEGNGRPNFVRAATGADRRVESNQDFFRRGNRNGHGNGACDDDEFFATPGKQAMRGALARSLSAAASSSPHQVGMALTPDSAKDISEVVGVEGGREPGMVGSKEVGGMDMAPDDWAEEVATQSENEMEGVVGPARSTTPTPTPAGWGSVTRTTPVPVPVTLTRGSKRMAMGTPRPTRHY